jgi:hypothetical protein
MVKYRFNFWLSIIYSPFSTRSQNIGHFHPLLLHLVLFGTGFAFSRVNAHLFVVLKIWKINSKSQNKEKIVPSRERPSPHGLRQTRPPPFPRRRTSGRTRALHTWKRKLWFWDQNSEFRAKNSHKVELVVKSSPCLGNCSCVREHAHRTRNFSQIASWDHGWRLVVDSNLNFFR